MTYYTNCAPKVTCDENSMYRTIDGSCNNLENPLWGATKTPYVRLGPATYDDGKYSFIRSEKVGIYKLLLILFKKLLCKIN